MAQVAFLTLCFSYFCYKLKSFFLVSDTGSACNDRLSRACQTAPAKHQINVLNND